MESQFASTVRFSIALGCLALSFGAVGCGGESAGDSSRGFRIEGTEPGDCDDGADNDADGLFDCADTSCSASPLCVGGGGGGGESGTGGAGGTAGGGGAGGSLLCADVDCDDQNECTTDACEPADGECYYTLVTDGMTCDFGGFPGVCGAGFCEDAMLCAGVDCDDQNECTTDTCNPTDGECAHTSITDGTSCDFGGLPGVCGAGVCEDAILCSGVDCDDGNECTRDACDPMDGTCGHTNVTDGTSCDFGGLPGLCAVGTCTEICLSIQVTPTRSIPNVMFLVDQSGSMTSAFGGGMDRWEATHSAITQTTSELDSVVRFGLTTYQSADGDMNPPCPRLDTQVDMQLNNFSTINASYPATFPGGEDTPTGDAIDALVGNIQSSPPPNEGPTIIVLATDGVPDSCEYPDPINSTERAQADGESVTAAGASHEAGIDLFVLWVGTLSDDATLDHLQEVANRGVGLPADGSGGDSPFWVGADPQSLDDAFRGIIRDSISCDVQMDKRFDDKAKACNEGDVRLNGTPLSCPDDWRVKPGVDDVIELLGSACDTLKSGDVTFSAEFPCGAIIVD